VLVLLLGSAQCEILIRLIRECLSKPASMDLLKKFLNSVIRCPPPNWQWSQYSVKPLLTIIASHSQLEVSTAELMVECFRRIAASGPRSADASVSSASAAFDWKNSLQFSSLLYKFINKFSAAARRFKNALKAVAELLRTFMKKAILNSLAKL